MTRRAASEMTDREKWLVTDDVTWMLDALGNGADEERCKTLVIAMRKIIHGTAWVELENLGGLFTSWRQCAVFYSIHPACDYIRCLWPSPFMERERVEYDGPDPIIYGNKGFTLSPLIDPRWRTSKVMDVARKVKGTEVGWEMTAIGDVDSAKPIAWEIGCEPDHEAMPILADALMDAGCDVPEIIQPLRRPHRLPCWVVAELLAS